MRVLSFPRIHLGLLDVGHTTRRNHGGCGFHIDGLPVEIEVVRSRKMEFVGMAQLDEEARADLRTAIERLTSSIRLPDFRIQLSSAIPQHIGLGSKTATVLGVLKAIDLALGLNLDKNTLQILSGRGGTSGVGVNSFFSGGFLADCGHSTSPNREFAPSSGRSQFLIPPIICRVTIPKDWRFHLILLSGRRLNAKREMTFFRKNAPIPRAEVLSSIGAVYHGVVPAILTRNLELLKDSIQDLHSTGFKARELRNQSDTVKGFIRDVNERTGFAVGMSSLGPLVYAIGTKLDGKGSKIIEDLIVKYRGDLLGVFRGRNHGYEVVK